MNRKIEDKRFFEVLFSVLIVFAFEALHIFWQDGGKVILSLSEGKMLPLSLVINLVYFVLFFTVLMRLLDYLQRKTVKHTRKEKLITLLLLIIAQLFLDFLRVFAAKKFSNSYMVVNDIFTFISALASFLILEKQIIHEESISKKIVIPLAIMITFLVAALICDLDAMKTVSHEFIKHAPYEARLRRIEANAEFRFWVRNALLDGAVFSTFFAWISYSSPHEVEPVPVMKEIGTTIVRILLLTVAVLLLQAAKLATYPQGSIATTTISYGPSECTEGGFYTESKELDIGRNYNGVVTDIFEETKVTVWQRRNKMMSFLYDGNFTSDYLFTHAPYNEQWYERKVSGIDVQIIANRFVLWDESRNGQCVDLAKNKERIYSRSFNGACEAVIADGYLEFFDYVCEYLIKYDREFIEPYIIRYSAGDFTETEIELNEHLNLDYISSVAAQYVQTK